jgi:REP element-mobilizing transposase RayT
MNYYRRKLPHWQPYNSTYFVTFRLANSLSKEAVVELQEERIRIQKNLKSIGSDEENEKHRLLIQKQIFAKYEDQLDEGSVGPHWLKQKQIAELVKDAIHYRDGEVYDLLAYCIMSNHVHIVFSIKNKDEQDISTRPVTDILGKLKSFTALQANRLLDRNGPFWHSESYDHVVRDWDELNRIIKYTLNNPVKAGLVSKWEEWPNNYLKEKLSG